MTSLFRLAISVAVVISCSLATAGAQEHNPWNRIQPQFRLAVSDPAGYELQGSHIELKSGRALIEPIESMVVTTPLSEIHINRRALVLLRTDKGIDRIFVLVGNAAIHVGKQAHSVQSGEEIAIADHEPNYNELVADEIGRRRVRTYKAENKTVILTEFSLVHAIEREPLLTSLVHTDSRDSKIIKDKLIKMAAVLGLVTSRHGPYSTSAR